MGQKKCVRCGEWKDEEEFNWRWKRLGRRQSVCRECTVKDRKDWYDAHADEVKQKSRLAKKKAIEEARHYVYQYLLRHPCELCGEVDPLVLTFDHVRGKKHKEISKMVSEGYSLEKIQEEIDKCMVLCFNCHMRKEKQKRHTRYFLF